jgi:hypothetical protein
VVLGPRRPAHLDPAEEALSIRLSEAERLDLASVFEAPATAFRP